ncbi:MAG: histidine phosphatase family protein [Anaerolineales bacterium]
MQLYFIRHGQSENNALWESTHSSEGRIPDPDLTDLGRKQAGAAAKFLSRSNLDTRDNQWDSGDRAGFGITHVYTSLMLRAVATANTIAIALNLPLLGWEDIHEWGGIYGWDKELNIPISLPGRARTFFEARYPNMVLPGTFNDEGWWNRPYETDENIPIRARRVLRDLLEKHGEGNDRVVMVSHGGFYNYFLAAVLDLSVEAVFRNKDRQIWFVLNNTAITRIDFTPGSTALVYLNRTDFLPDDLIM